MRVSSHPVRLELVVGPRVVPWTLGKPALAGFSRSGEYPRKKLLRGERIHASIPLDRAHTTRTQQPDNRNEKLLNGESICQSEALRHRAAC